MPTAPPSRCLVCKTAWATTRGRCPDCYVPWQQTSKRNANVSGKTKAAFRRAVLRRDPVCRSCGNAASTEADHVLPIADGGAWHVDNGQGLCTPCHDAKTRRENAERNRRRARGTRGTY